MNKALELLSLLNENKKHYILKYESYNTYKSILQGHKGKTSIFVVAEFSSKEEAKEFQKRVENKYAGVYVYGPADGIKQMQEYFNKYAKKGIIKVVDEIDRNKNFVKEIMK